MDLGFGGAASLITGAKGIYDLVSEIKDQRRREDAMLRLLYLEVVQNLKFIDALRLGTSNAPPVNHADYVPVGHGLRFYAHQAVFTEGLLDQGRLHRLGNNGEKLNVVEISDDGTGQISKRPLKIGASEVLSRSCAAGAVLATLADLKLGQEVQRDTRYGVRLKTIEAYEKGLNHHLRTHERLEDIFIHDYFPPTVEPGED